MNTRKHFWMMIGCLIPLMIIFLLPVFGVNSPILFLIFIVVIYFFHLFMTVHYVDRSNNNDSENQTNKEEIHEDH